MKRYKDTMVAPGSTLWDLMHKKAANPEEVRENKKALEKQYEQTTLNYNDLHSKEVQEYFAEKQREHFAKIKAGLPPLPPTIESITK